MDAIANVMPDMDDAAKSRRGERKEHPRAEEGNRIIFSFWWNGEILMRGPVIDLFCRPPTSVWKRRPGAISRFRTAGHVGTAEFGAKGIFPL